MDAHFPTQHLSAKLAVALKPLDYKKGYPKMKITTIGMDLAKTVFQIHGVDEHGKVAVRKKLKRAEVLNYYANLPSCLIGMKACGGAHYWARKLQAYGHTVKLMAPQFVKPYVKTNKNDMADAEAICEAVSRSTCGLCQSRTSSNKRSCGRFNLPPSPDNTQSD
jgi:hypothetical protein